MHLNAKNINGERVIPGRQKVIRGSNIPVLTSHACLNHVRKFLKKMLFFWKLFCILEVDDLNVERANGKAENS